MSDNEINKLIHERILSRCWHEKTQEPDYEYNGNTKCAHCSLTYNDGLVNDPFEELPNYCQSLDAVSEVEKAVIEKVGVEYGFHLRSAVCPHIEGPNRIAMCIATADARTRALACLKAMGIEVTEQEK